MIKEKIHKAVGLDYKSLSSNEENVVVVWNEKEGSLQYQNYFHLRLRPSIHYQHSWISDLYHGSQVALWLIGPGFDQEGSYNVTWAQC